MGRLGSGQSVARKSRALQTCSDSEDAIAIAIAIAIIDSEPCKLAMRDLACIPISLPSEMYSGQYRC